MKRSGMFVSTVFGGLGFVVFGLGGALSCSVYWTGHGSLVCGGVFILLAPVGSVVGLAVVWLARALMRELIRRPANSGN